MARSVNRGTLLRAVVGALGIGVIAIAAATLDDRQDPGSGAGGGDGAPGIVDPVTPDPGTGLTIPFLSEILLGLAAIFVLLVLVYLARDHRRALGLVAVIAGFGLLVYLIGQFLPTGNGFEPVENDFTPNLSPGEGGSGDDTSAGTVDWLPIVGLLGVFGIVLLVAVAMGTRDSVTSVITPSESTDEDSSDDAVRSAIGEAAGRAADRLEEGDSYDNDVYQAWADMTALLDVSRPETVPPRRFAAAAIDAGLEPPDVNALTTLFEEVRYGDRSPTPEREERAIDLLRRIEARYTEAE